MAQKEREFSKEVRKILKEAGCHCYPVETGQTVVGFPDLVVMGQGGASFLELKSRLASPLAKALKEGQEGPGQRAFARLLARSSAFLSGEVEVSSCSFLLMECMDGVALLVEEEEGAYPAAVWEGMPQGADLRDAVRAWRTRCQPSREAAFLPKSEALSLCLEAYQRITGIEISSPPSAGKEALGRGDGGKREAVKMARDICDAARFSLLMTEIRKDKTRLVPIEKGKGYVIIGGE